MVTVPEPEFATYTSLLDDAKTTPIGAEPPTDIGSPTTVLVEVLITENEFEPALITYMSPFDES
jgi:hypothetical protein